MSTRREIARSITDWLDMQGFIDKHHVNHRSITERVDKLLRDRDERAAKIAQDSGTVFYKERQKQHSPYDPKDLIFGQDVCDKIAAAIRKDD